MSLANNSIVTNTDIGTGAAALVCTTTSVLLQTLKLSGTFPMEIQSQTIQPYHTKEIEIAFLEE